MRWASAASDKESLDEAVEEVVSRVGADLEGSPPDLALVFVSPHHAAEYERIPSLVLKRLGTTILMGCSGEGIIGGGQEVERRPGFSLTAAHLPGVGLVPFHLEGTDLPDLDASPQAWESIVQTSAERHPQFVLLADPFTFPAERLIQGLDYAFGASVKIGGLASGAQEPGGNALYLSPKVHRSGAVGLAIYGNILVDTIVAQGCRPIGRQMHITRCEQNLLLEMDGQQSIVVLEQLFASLGPKDQELARSSLFLGIARDPLQDTLGLGDFLIRNPMGIDQRSGGLIIGERLEEGQLVQFHLRDAQTSSEELKTLLSHYADTHRSSPEWGTLLFSCVGRGMHLYGQPDHDTDLFRKWVGAVPLGGFFCNGEIGPVGDGTFLHGYTSSFGIFRPRQNW